MPTQEKSVDELSALTILEAAELSKLLEEKWGVSAAAAVAVAITAVINADQTKLEATRVAEEARFDVTVVDKGNDPDKVVAVIQAVTGLPDEDMRAKTAAPVITVRENVTAAEAGGLIQLLESAGATVSWPRRVSPQVLAELEHRAEAVSAEAGNMSPKAVASQVENQRQHAIGEPSQSASIGRFLLLTTIGFALAYLFGPVSPVALFARAGPTLLIALPLFGLAAAMAKVARA